MFPYLKAWLTNAKNIALLSATYINNAHKRPWFFSSKVFLTITGSKVLKTKENTVLVCPLKFCVQCYYIFPMHCYCVKYSNLIITLILISVSCTRAKATTNNNRCYHNRSHYHYHHKCNHHHHHHHHHQHHLTTISEE